MDLKLNIFYLIGITSAHYDSLTTSTLDIFVIILISRILDVIVHMVIFRVIMIHDHYMVNYLIMKL